MFSNRCDPIKRSRLYFIISNPDCIAILETPSPPPMNIRQLEDIMKRASQSKKRRNEMQGKSKHIREMKEDGMLRKLGTEMIRDKSIDRLSRMGRSECEENRDKLERLKVWIE